MGEDALPQADECQRLFLRCIGWKRERRDGYHVLTYTDTLAQTGCEDVETTERKRSILFAGFVARMNNERLPKRVMFGEVDRGKGYSGWQEQGWTGCLERDLSLSKALDVSSKEAG